MQINYLENVEQQKDLRHVQYSFKLMTLISANHPATTVDRTIN